MVIRHAVTHDASSLAVLSIEVWVGTYLRHGVSKFFADYALSAFTTAKFEDIISENRETLLVSQNRDGVDGFIRIDFDSEAPLPGCSTTEIKTLYVQPRHQGKGVGASLLKEAFRICAENGHTAVWLTVNSENRAAIDVYRAKGFDPIGETAFRIDDQLYPNIVMTRSV